MNSLVADDKLCPEAINAVSDGHAMIPWLTADHQQAAGAAVACGRLGEAQAIPALIPLLSEEGLVGRSAAWALAQLGAVDALLEAAGKGKLDGRENAYHGLTICAARQTGQNTLGDAVIACVNHELERARSGRSGLGEQACRVLATLGDERALAHIQSVIDGDPLTDRFELQRLRKAIAEHGFDQESRELATLPWEDYFAHDLLTPEVGSEEPQIEPSANDELSAEAFDAAQQQADQMAADPTSTQPDKAEQDLSAEDEAGDESEGGHKVDVAAYIAAHGEATSPDLQLVSQVVPMLEQLAQQAVQVPLHQLGAQEFALLILQVLPQALPPQYLQALLSPQAINALAQLFRWHHRQGGSRELLDGLNLVRQQLQEQVRASGMLGGPDFSDPFADEDHSPPQQGL